MKKIRIVAVLFALLVALFSLSSCAQDVVVYSPNDRVSIVINDADSTATERVGYNEISQTIRAMIGDNCRSITDDLLQSNFEIVIGSSARREASTLAAEFLASNELNDGDTESYVFYYKDNAIAIVASSDFAMDVAIDVFIETYLQADTLVVSSDMLEFKQFSKAAYIAEQDAKITAEEEERWEHRWDAVRNIVGSTGLEAIQRLYEWWGTEWLEWAVGLYDPSSGGFYYAASARDYYGFGADIESTAQLFNLFDEFGLFSWSGGGSWIQNVPAEMRAKLATFVNDMQDPDDHYFYHPQWGKDIGTSARGRHLSQAIYLLWVAGADSKYKSPLDTGTAMGEGTSEVITAFMDSDEHKSSVVFTASTLPDYMQSTEAVRAYLDKQWEEHYNVASGQNSYGFGHLLSSQANQFKAAGDDIINEVCDWLDEHQREDNGFWEETTEEKPDSAYRAISGLIKISSVYGNAGRPFYRTDKMVDTAIDIMLSEVPPAHVCYIYNPVGAFSSIISSMKKLPGMEDAIVEAKQKFIYKLPDIVTALIEKQQVFRKELGSFSYVPERSDPNSQGLRISLGFPEGDVNATAVSMHYVADGLFGVLGTQIVPMFRYSDYKWFVEQISEAAEPIKQDLMLEDIDFEDGDINSRITYPDATGYTLEVVDSEKDSEDDLYALQIDYAGGSTSRALTVEMKTAISPTCTSFSLDMNFMSATTEGYLYSLHLQSRESSRIGYQLQFFVTGNGTVNIAECSYERSISDPSAFVSVYTPIATVDMNEWFNLRVEYYPVAGSELNVKVYVDTDLTDDEGGKCVYLSQRPYLNGDDFGKVREGRDPYTIVHSGMNLLRFSCFSGSNKTKVMLDNIKCHHGTETFDGSDYNPGN